MSTYDNLKSVVRISGLSSEQIMVKRSVRQGGVLSTFLYLVYVNDLLKDLELSGYGAKVMSVSCGNPAFADDVSLLALTPFHLQKMVDIVFKFCEHWSVSINVAKSSVTVFTKSRSQPIANIVYGDCPIIQTDSFVHLGILYSYNLKYKDKICQRLQKAKNALFSNRAFLAFCKR